MTEDEIMLLLSRIKWGTKGRIGTFFLARSSLFCAVPVICVESGAEVMAQGCVGVPSGGWKSPQQVIEAVTLLSLSAQAHETTENLRIDGQPVFEPHHEGHADGIRQLDYLLNFAAPAREYPLLVEGSNRPATKKHEILNSDPRQPLLWKDPPKIMVVPPEEFKVKGSSFYDEGKELLKKLTKSRFEDVLASAFGLPAPTRQIPEYVVAKEKEKLSVRPKRNEELRNLRDFLHRRDRKSPQWGRAS